VEPVQGPTRRILAPIVLRILPRHISPLGLPPDLLAELAQFDGRLILQRPVSDRRRERDRCGDLGRCGANDENGRLDPADVVGERTTLGAGFHSRTGHRRDRDQDGDKGQDGTHDRTPGVGIPILTRSAGEKFPHLI
jgi:hypothetical protein